MSGPGPPDSSGRPLELTDLRGVGPRTAAALRAAGVGRAEDLAFHLPLRYERYHGVASLAQPGSPGDWVVVRGTLDDIRRVRTRRRRLQMVRALLVDEEAAVRLVWFNQGWMAGRLHTGMRMAFRGRIRVDRWGFELVNPTVVEQVAEDVVVPVYRRLGPLAGKRLRQVIRGAVAAVVSGRPDPLPEAGRDALPELTLALRRLHDPDPGDTDEDIEEARRRLAFDELLLLCGRARLRRRRRAQLTAPACRVDDRTRQRARGRVPFQLTAAQRRVIAEIVADLSAEAPMARLLQGDVGSGKTVVAALVALVAVDSGHQVALMAPTELVARQHSVSLRSLLEAAEVPVWCLTGSTGAAERREALGRLAEGVPGVVVGTHALFQDGVGLPALGLVVVDEQHRFGVAQRQALVAKGRAPHLLVMTATPIPRSLALTVHGDLAVSVIDELPPGRRPVRTVVRDDDARPRLMAFLDRELARGGRAFWVFPTIEESESSSAPALVQAAGRITAELPHARAGVVHGRLPAPERERATDAFRAGELNLLLGTTVVEVGVDVPEATVMVVEGADRFGLAQLHQLRGRVGRGSRRSWCVLLATPDASAVARKRLATISAIQDGFRIAEEDLATRGPGDPDGIRQWGRDGLRFADLARDGDLVRRAHTQCNRFDAARQLEDVVQGLDRLYGSEDSPSVHEAG